MFRAIAIGMFLICAYLAFAVPLAMWLGGVLRRARERDFPDE